MRGCITILLLMLAMAGGADNARANGDLVADLSLEQVAITTDFNGKNLLLFGAVAGEEGDDIIVEFKGPDAMMQSRRKERISGIWINTQTVQWENAPGFYHVFSTRNIGDILMPSQQYRLGLGYQYLGLKAAAIQEEDAQIWLEALHRNMTEKGLWHMHEGAVSMVRGLLFRTPVFLPANILPGDYNVRVFHVRDGEVLAVDKTSILVAKRGIGGLIYRIAHDYALFYGLFAVGFAVFSGWLAAAAFRKR